MICLFGSNDTLTLQVLERWLETTDRFHPYFLDLKQSLHCVWEDASLEVVDTDYPDTVGAIYPPAKDVERLRQQKRKRPSCMSLIVPCMSNAWFIGYSMAAVLVANMGAVQETM